MAPYSHRDAVARFRQTLKEQGLFEAMRVVNAVSTHRFTAIYYFDGPTLRNLLLVDKGDPDVRSCPDIPVLESYCVYVRQSSAAFLTEDSPRDERVAGHPKQQTVQSYCGIPLMSSEGTLYGTICHFDFQPRPFSRDEVELLESVAPLVVRAIESGAADALMRRESAA